MTVATIERPKGGSRFELDPTRAAEAAKAVIESIRAVAEGDDELIADMVEGETGLFEVLDRLVGRIVETQAYVTGIETQVQALADRKERFKKRIETHRALIEQGLMIAGLPKAERPCATLSMAQRGAKLVVDTEADIPSAFWKVGDPVLDKKALAEALKEAAGAREARITEWRALHGQDVPLPNDLPPEIPGAHLEESAPSLTLRLK